MDDPEQILLAKIASGQSVAFDQLVHHHADRLLSLAIVMLRNRSDAEDAVQETFLAVYEGAAKFKGKATVKTWITRILVNRIARVRRQRRWGKFFSIHQDQSADPINQVVTPGLGQTEQTQLRLDTHQAIAQLKEEFRNVVVLRELQGFNYAQIAQILSVPVGTVESRIYRARQQLKQSLTDYHPPPPEVSKDSTTCPDKSTSLKPQKKGATT